MSDIRWQEDALAAEAEESTLSRGDLIRAAVLAGAAFTAAGPLAERAFAATP